MGVQLTSIPAVLILRVLLDPVFREPRKQQLDLHVLKHDTTDYSTGFLPVGPNRSGDTELSTSLLLSVVKNGNFDINITSAGISVFGSAAPSTGIDSSSGLNGWLRVLTLHMPVLVYLEVELAVMVVTVVHLIIRTEFKC